MKNSPTFINDNLETIKSELRFLPKYTPTKKDILIVLHNQLSYFKSCVTSIFENTEDFNLYIWDNASDGETKDYLKSLKKQHSNVFASQSKNNLGFLLPNNKLAKKSKSPYIILLNSDTIVRKDWDKVLISLLQSNKDISQVGYSGGLLDKNGIGVFAKYGFKVDYVEGWCFCISREIYNDFGLFDQKNLKFAYCEDADFSLRLKESGKKIYASFLDLVHHFGNRTAEGVMSNTNIQLSLRNNHRYLAKRWSKYLSNDRILAERIN